MLERSRGDAEVLDHVVRNFDSLGHHHRLHRAPFLHHLFLTQAPAGQGKNICNEILNYNSLFNAVFCNDKQSEVKKGGIRPS